MNSHVYNFIELVSEKIKLKDPMLEIGSKIYTGDFETNIKLLFPDKKCFGLDIKRGRGVDIQGDAHCLPFKNQIFNAVFLLETIEHLWCPQVATKEIARVLKIGGFLIASVLHIHNSRVIKDGRPWFVGTVYPVHNKEDWWRFSDYSIVRLLKENNLKRKLLIPTKGRVYLVAEKKSYKKKIHEEFMS